MKCKCKVNLQSFSSTNVEDMHNNVKPILQHTPEYIILPVGTNNALNFSWDDILDNILELKIIIEEIRNKDCQVIISMPMHCQLENRLYCKRVDKHAYQSRRSYCKR